MKYDAGNRLSGQVIGAAITVHRAMGPGLDESVYETLMCAELAARGIAHEPQVPLPLKYKGMRLDCGFRLDLWVERRLIVEIKSVETVLPIHEAQLLTYLRLAPCELGLLINFDVPAVKQGIRRLIWSGERAANGRNESTDKADGHSKFPALSGEVLGAAVEVHRQLGPGLLRSAYEACLCHELTLRGIPFERSKCVPICYREVEVPTGMEMPLLVSGKLPVICLSVPKLTPLFHARLLGQLRLGRWLAGLLINFNVTALSKGVRRVVNSASKTRADLEDT